MNIEEEVRQVVASALGVEVSAITAETAAGELRAWDSVRTVMILTSVQEYFGLQFPEDDLFDLMSVGAITDEVRKLKEAK